MKKPSKYVVSVTLISNPKKPSKKMLDSFGGYPAYCFDRLKEARLYAREMNESEWAEICGSVGRWVVVERATKQIKK